MLHLNVKRCKKLEPLPAGIVKLSSLQILKVTIFRMEEAGANVLQLADLKKLTLLQHLSMTIDVRSSSQANEASSFSQDVIRLPEGTFEGMTKLRTVLLSKSSCRLDLTTISD